MENVSRLAVVGTALILVVSLFLVQCDQEQFTPPELSIDDVLRSRQTADQDFEFVVTIPEVSRADASVDFTTLDGTAVAGVDFTASSGTATIPAGSLSTSIKIKVKADSLRRSAQVFYLVVSNPTNCTISRMQVTATIDNSNGLYLPVDNTGYSTPTSYPNYTLMWSDEFSGNTKTINQNYWAFETGNDGWGAHELQYYTTRSQNAFVTAGNLILEARKESFSGADYTSARLTTKGKKSFKYGRIDIRAKVPRAEGVMSALWMLGSNINTVGWPTCGEIDIMQLGRPDNEVYHTLHWGVTPNQFASHLWLGNDTDNKFHVFSAVWDANHIDMYIDDRLSFSMNTSGATLPFNSDFFFIFNLAVGGDWARTPGANASFPQRVVIDYVRVFQ